MCQVKETFKRYPDAQTTTQQTRQRVDNNEHKVSKGYKWRQGPVENPPWTKIAWTRPALPRHAFITFVLLHHRLPTKMRLNKFISTIDTYCTLCKATMEDDLHLFFQCSHAAEGAQTPRVSPPKTKGPKIRNCISYAIFIAAIYFICSARNHATFRNQIVHAKHTSKMIKEQVMQRLLFLNTISGKYTLYIHHLLTRSFTPRPSRNEKA
ncbi:hypothetical protein Cgig2_004561 [Carnegiea gigantea]|uniref:Reverse transcriptase zinc-binding domain-containing protein n=1 Tax=Carnegiea gigantea TaxID=171969 RepID=A0A9Q1GLA7_9CARY|nr:hypothetical protein Cgig2_004561 [Carnegiea gigantea]